MKKILARKNQRIENNEKGNKDKQQQEKKKTKQKSGHLDFFPLNTLFVVVLPSRLFLDERFWSPYIRPN